MEQDCWLWARAIERTGYGRIWAFNADKGKSEMQLVHRVVYRAFKGDIPKELEIDHMCRVRRCINPDHLRVLTHADNLARRIILPKPGEKRNRSGLCMRGHKLTGHNLLARKIKKTGKIHTQCRKCRNAGSRARYRREKN